MLFITYLSPVLFQVDKVPSPLGDLPAPWAMLRMRSAGDIPLSHQPHVCLTGEWAQPLAYVGPAGFHPTMVSHHHHPGTAPLVNLMQTGCLSLSISFIACHALKRMPELRQEGASMHIYTRTTAVGGGGEPVEIMVENVQLHSHRLKGKVPFFPILFFSKLKFKLYSSLTS